MAPKLKLAKVEVDEKYEGVAKELLSETPQQYRESMAQLLDAPQTKDSYMIMRDQKVPLRAIKSVLLHGMEDLEQGRTVSEGAYLEAIGKELKTIDKYGSVVHAMEERGYLSKETGSKAKGELGEQRDKYSPRHIESDLVAIAGGRKVAAVLFAIAGLTFILISGVSFTGNVVGGNGLYPSALFVIGLAVFLAGLIVGRRN
jgi:hypothetical protein